MARLVKLPDTALLFFVLLIEYSQGTWYACSNRLEMGKGIKKPLGFKIAIQVKLPFRKLWALSLESHGQQVSDFPLDDISSFAIS